jgi:serine protease AprX
MWGQPGDNCTEGRQTALWGRGKRGAVAALTVAALAVPVVAQAAPTTPPNTAGAHLSGTLLADAKASPGKKFRVIVELKKNANRGGFATKVRGLGSLKREFRSINGVSAELPGAAIVALSRLGDVFAITRDARIEKTDFAPAQVWQQSIGADVFWPGHAGSNGVKPPTIAIVDSGIDTTRVADFGARVVANVALSQLAPGATNDGAGHGTFVAAMAAGASSSFPGVAPTADLVNLRVMDDNGMALTSDVIAAADWILQHKDEYGIRVANFSLMSASGNSFKFDPLDHAVERLWFAGVTVVAAAGNQGNETRLPMVYAPANDPFVITVGAAWTHDTADRTDDTVAPFSAYGHTADGFGKPELVAPGRYVTSAMSSNATIYAAKADRVVAPGYLNISGTSFAAPVVAGAAAVLLAQHPGWTPGQVKGALMLTAEHLSAVADPLAAGVGEIRIPLAAELLEPPNANAGLDRFVVADGSAAGGKAFDAATWTTVASTDPTWNAVSWDEVSWDEVSWDEISWDSVSWDEVSWDEVSWDEVSWDEVSWESVSWDEASQAESSLAEVSWLDASSAN